MLPHKMLVTPRYKQLDCCECLSEARVERQTGKAIGHQHRTELTAATMEISYSYHVPLAMATVVACATNTLPPPYVTTIKWAEKQSLAPSIS